MASSMIYVIDANNLAGRLNLLLKKDFDTILIERLNRFFSGKKVEVFLVFDSSDPLGDKYKSDNIKVIYAPKDDHCGSADKKIIELVKRYNNDKREMVVVTDDVELARKAKKSLSGSGQKKLQIEGASGFGERLKKKEATPIEDKANRGSWSKPEVEEFNKNLLNRFKKYKK